MTDLYDMIPALKAEINVPGADLLTDAANGDYVQILKNAYWEIVLDRVITSSEYELDENTDTIDPSLPGNLKQLMVIYASFKIVLNQLLNVNTRFRSHAGPVEYEVERSASLLNTILKNIADRKKAILEDLIEQQYGSGGSYMFDMITARDAAFVLGTGNYVTSWAD